MLNCSFSSVYGSSTGDLSRRPLYFSGELWCEKGHNIVESRLVRNNEVAGTELLLE